MCACVSVRVRVSACVDVCLCVRVSVCLSTFMTVCPFFLSVCLFASLFVRLCVCLFVWQCTTRFSFYKNILYKNIEDEMGQKVKNILRICSS